MFLKAGADIVIFSTQKAFAGFTGGVVAGRKELVQACAYQERGIGRPMKAGKETVISAIAALERWMALDHGQRARDLTARLERAKAKIEQLRGITVTLEEDATSHAFHRLLLFVQAGEAGISAFELSRALWDETPSISCATSWPISGCCKSISAGRRSRRRLGGRAHRRDCQKRQAAAECRANADSESRRPVLGEPRALAASDEAAQLASYNSTTSSPPTP